MLVITGLSTISLIKKIWIQRRSLINRKSTYAVIFAASLFLSIFAAFGENIPNEQQTQPKINSNEDILNEKDVATVNAAYEYEITKNTSNNETQSINSVNVSDQVKSTDQSNSQQTEVKTRPVYITSDNINSRPEDMARINAVVNGLKAKGVYAVNYGVGPNEHSQVLGDQLPSNALIVNIYGGACAGTLYEMGTPDYKEKKGAKKVFTIFYPTSVKITGLNWLPRAYDDNFSPAGFSGLSNPDQYLLKNGYNYIETGDVQYMTESVYQEALL